MSLKLKTILGVALIEAVLLLFLVTMTVDYLRDTNYEGVEKRATTIAKLFAATTQDAVLGYDLATLESLVQEVKKNPDIVYARVTDSLGRSLAQEGDVHALSRPFVQDYSVSAVDDEVFDVSEDVGQEGMYFGRVELGIDILSLNQKIAEVQQWTRFVALLEMALVAFFSFVLGSYLTSQLTTLRDSAKAIALGDLNVEVPVRSNDEVAELAHSFNQMASNLREEKVKRDDAEKELKELNLSLEVRVKDRTRALQHKNRELLEANREIKEAQKRLLQSEKMASLGVMAAGVAHEINNPVGYVTSNFGTLQEYIGTYNSLLELYKRFAHSDDLDERKQLLLEITKIEARDDLDFIHSDMPVLLNETTRGLERVRNIVKGLREFSHADPRQSMMMCDLNDVIHSTLSIARTQFKHRCEVVLELADLPSVLCDKGKMGQVLLNLMVNASQAIVGEGVITIKSRLVEGAVEIDVIDSGVGMDEVTQGKIFDPFYTTKPVGEGTGLGLAICFNILQEHGGTISVASHVGQGSTFTIKLPV